MARHPAQRHLDTGVVVRGQNSVRGGHYEYWGCPAQLRNAARLVFGGLAGTGRRSPARQRLSSRPLPMGGSAVGTRSSKALILEQDGAVTPTVIAVSRDSGHRFSKVPVDVVTLLAGLGVADDAHAGVTVQHRSRVAADPTQPNLRQAGLSRRAAE